MDPKLLVGLAGVPVVTALVELVKPFLPDSRLWPVAAVAAAIVLNLAVAAVAGSQLAEAALVGLVAGLAASGLYSTGKTYLG